MRAIAVRIGYTPTAIYHHFRDKTALIEELCLADFTALARALHTIGRIEDPVERVRRMGLAYAEFALANPSQYRFMFMTQHEHKVGDLKKPDEDAYAFLLATVSEGIDAGRYRPELRDPHMVSQMLWAGIHGVISLWMTHEHDPFIEWRPPLETIRTTVDVLIRGATTG